MTRPQSEHEDIRTATDVLLRYESLRDRGEEVTPEALCERLGCSHLLEEVRRRVRELESFKQFLRSTDTAEYATPTGAGPAPAPGPVAPQRIEHYEILSRLGQGGFGIVWRARDTELDRPVAVKVPRPDRRFSGDELEQFYQEARKAAALDHPNIVRVYHARRLGKTFFLVTEFVDGGSLATRKAERPLSPAEAVRLVAQVAEALHHAHLRGFVHRDVKPGNILLNRDGKPYLADFGLAVTEEEQLGEAAAVLGTVAYMSPEQAAGGNRRVDARTDVYSLGVVLYELLTGRLPFVARTAYDYLEQIRNREPRPPRTIDDSLPPELERILLKCLARSVTDRYTTAADLAADLQRWLERGAATPTEPRPQRAPSPRRRPWLWATAGLFAAAVAAAAFLYFGRPPGGTPDSRPQLQADTPRPGKPSEDALPAARAPEPGKWHNLLVKEPQILIRPRKIFVKEFFPGEKFFWHTHGDCAFRLGAADVPDYAVEITLEQSRLVGHRGLFLGGRPVARQGKEDFYEAQALLLVAARKPWTGVGLTHYRLVLNLKTGAARLADQLSPDVFLSGVSPLRVTLAVRVEQGRLASVTVNQGQVRGLDRAPGAGPFAPTVGDFGVFADQEQAWLSTAIWKVSRRKIP